MPIALDPNRTTEYALKSDRAEDGTPKPDATVFELRSLTVRERAEVADAFYGATPDGGIAYTPHQAKLLAARRGLAGWRGFRIAAGGAFEPRRENGRTVNVGDALERLAIAHVVEIGDEVLRMSKLSEDDAGN